MADNVNKTTQVVKGAVVGATDALKDISAGTGKKLIEALSTKLDAAYEHNQKMAKVMAELMALGLDKGNSPLKPLIAKQLDQQLKTVLELNAQQKNVIKQAQGILTKPDVDQKGPRR
jgi:hypothetical protein